MAGSLEVALQGGRVSPQRLGFGAHGPQALPCSAVSVESPCALGVEEPVDEIPERGIARQREVLVLGNDLDRAVQALRQRAGRDHGPVQVGPRLGAADAPRGHQFPPGKRKSSLDTRLGSVGPHPIGACGVASQEAEGSKQERLAGTGLSRDRHEAGARLDVCAPDDPQVLYAQLVKHRGGGTSL